MSYLIFDIEGDGLHPTKIWCMSYYDGEVSNTTTDYNTMRKLLTSYDYYIGHNIARWDIPHLERLLDITVKGSIIDTLVLSWALYPQRRKHGLEEFGVEYGIPKPKIEDWHNLTVEEYSHRCAEDDKINTRLWSELWSKLMVLYDNNRDAALRYIKYLEFKIDCARKQEEYGWKLDIDKTKELLSQLESEEQTKVSQLQDAMPLKRIFKQKSMPKRMYKADGSITKLGEAWLTILSNHNLPKDHQEPVEIEVGSEAGNPASSVQIKDWLFSLGWKPQTYKHVREDSGAIREIPQINLEPKDGGGICPSIQSLYSIEPSLELLEGLGIIQHRLSMLRGFLENVQDNGYVQARVAGLTNTLRFKHAILVNLPRADKAYGKEIRSLLCSPDGYELCGSDMVSLEDRIKQHYIYPHDPEYVNKMSHDDYDPHLDLAVMAGLMTQEQSDNYKANEKGLKPIRSIAKGGNYACQYGAFPKRLAITCAISIEQATILHEGYWKLNWAIKEVAKTQTIKDIDGEMWLLNPVNNFWYSLRTEKDIFSTLVQGTASYVFDTWVRYIIQDGAKVIAQFHDEVIIAAKEGYRDYIKSFLVSCIDKTNNQLKLNRELGIDVQFGENYSEIH